eukprot:scaffold607346_cov33-Prasinocladus_malaysianus.AAC.1
MDDLSSSARSYVQRISALCCSDGGEANMNKEETEWQRKAGLKVGLMSWTHGWKIERWVDGWMDWLIDSIDSGQMYIAVDR